MGEVAVGQRTHCFTYQRYVRTSPPAQTNTSVFADHIHSYLIVRTPVLVDLLINIHCRNQMGGHILPSGQSSCVTLFRPIAMHALRVKIRLLVRGQTGLLLLGAF